MSFDQKIQLANTIGTWLAAIATFAAVLFSLYLARASSKINLRVLAGIRVIFEGSEPRYYFGVNITNKADRNVVITSIGWSIGKKKNAQYCIQPFYAPLSAKVPITLQYGEASSFLIPISDDEVNNWLIPFAEGFVKSFDEKHLKTLKLWVETSVGERVELLPENNFLEKLKECSHSRNT
ncbi:hypothetical protein NMT15_003069 [Vibrio cholerae]|uniref:hypothetical protein n=1 Tax=Vibrio cholerae TaxID=666 RepID=UPI002A207B06|nr:hypothetical protein [Vibrio cholerae]EHY0954242.1 hypothetical protein [Vibrio cholerae]EJL6908833.1 hypothetical protein [Vibrio cholerae]